jgi:UDP-N-acetylmuramoyl-L-alanyl-D-glutamate--2,6-diaminopimelate ligase
MQESKFLEKILKIGRKIIPKSLFKAGQPIYHYLLAVLGAVIYGFPGRELVVIGITGTKGKTSTVQLVNSIFEQAGYKTALASTLRYKIGEKEWRNLFKMTLRGRFFTQNFLRKAVNAGCTHAIIEVSSEGVPQFRHKFLFLDALIFTNLAPEHIESHGSYENYLKAKLTIAKELIKHKKKNLINISDIKEEIPGLLQRFLALGPVMVANKDDKESEKFLNLNIKNKVPYSLNDVITLKSDEKGSSFQIGKIVIHSKLPGIFNVSNMLAAIAIAKFAGISADTIKRGVESVGLIRGRMEKIDTSKFLSEGKQIDVIVDYAHTPDSLTAVYETYKKEKYFIIGILGNTGGGRDKWKRAEMGKIADKYCNHIILTNEDPYDEDPLEILNDMKKGIKRKPCEIILDRRAAITFALEIAKIKADDGSENKIAVLITGKGTDPYIMGPNGTKQEWDDATVVREELQKVFKK